MCADLLQRQLAYSYVIDGITRRQVPSNVPYPDGGAPEFVVQRLDELKSTMAAKLPTDRCGPALRLTTSEVFPTLILNLVIP